MEKSSVSPNDFELKLKSKKDLFAILTKQRRFYVYQELYIVGYFLPKYLQRPMTFLRDLFEEIKSKLGFVT